MSSQHVVPAGLLLIAIVTVASPGWAGREDSDLVQASDPLPEASLLDISILLFDPGLPEKPAALRELKEVGIFPEVRKAEARYIPVHLARTLQRAGFWGAARVVPGASTNDLTVSGAILSSSGAELKLAVRAVDSRGKVWLDTHYKTRADASVYLGRAVAADPFQELYNRIANDIRARRKKLDEKDVARIRDVSLLRFAADLAPVAFSNYLAFTKGRFSLVRLPARDNPMIARVERLRGRDRMLIDTLDSYYRDFYERMREAYDGWRSQDYWRREAMKRSGGRSRRTVGSSNTNRSGTSLGFFPTGGNELLNGGGTVCGTPRFIGGTAGSSRSKEYRQSSRIDHVAVLRELGASLASDMAPLLVEVEGRVLRLTGSAETQYARWRELLREIFATETGLPVSEGSAGSATN